MKKIITIILLIINVCGNAQDTIITKTGKRIVVDIIDTVGGIITYIPVQTVYKIEVESVNYKNGQVQAYAVLDNTPQIDRLKKGNKVFIEAEDNGVYEHTKYCLESWQF